MKHPVLITGGAGFIGTNLARSFLDHGIKVHIFDNLSRRGVEGNLSELQHAYPPGLLEVTIGDVRDAQRLFAAVANSASVYHLAAQVAVTSSIENPMADAQTNLLGTLNVLEAIRQTSHQPPMLFTSTNKVYGKLGGLKLQETADRWQPLDTSLAQQGIDETQPLCFLSPYGCSKGSADQYVLDYAHSYGVEATVFRMSCIYGPHQLGSEDQGWVAHFVRQSLKRGPVTIYGDGKQVRDLLFVDDLVVAMRLALDEIERTRGQAFNLGGGPQNSISLRVLLDKLAAEAPRLHVEWDSERIGDQKWYVANGRKISDVLHWTPSTSIGEGLAQLVEWYEQRPSLVARAEAQVA